MFKDWQRPFSRKIHFYPSLGKKRPKWQQNRFFYISWKVLSLVFFGNNLTLTLIFLILLFNINPISGMQGYLKCNMSRKKWMVNFVFGIQIKIEFFYKLMLSLWLRITRHAQSTPKNKFTISLQYLEET